MSYADYLGRATTAEQVFYDLYGQAEMLVAELDAITPPLDGATRAIPGTELALQTSLLYEGSEPETIGTTSVFVQNGDNMPVPLLGRSRSLPVSLHTSTQPLAVVGYRGKELDPDYGLSKRSGLIKCSLGRSGLKATLDLVSNSEPIGATLIPPDKRAKRLRGEDRTRFELAVNGIFDNLEAARRIREGTSAVEVLRNMGKIS